MADPARELAGFIAMRSLVPGAVELVYDNYNALAIGFAATEKQSSIVLSIALYPRWVSLFFARGAALPDPKRVLQGSGSTYRYIVLDDGAATLDRPEVRALLERALERADPPILPTDDGRIVIKSIAANQRPRRPDVLKATGKSAARTKTKTKPKRAVKRATR